MVFKRIASPLNRKVPKVDTTECWLLWTVDRSDNVILVRSTVDLVHFLGLVCIHMLIIYKVFSSHGIFINKGNDMIAFIKDKYAEVHDLQAQKVFPNGPHAAAHPMI